ncbi:MAG: EAL domain-containing protein [Gammaproteobacteria bacterium]|nr:EAL domain-containing protein [Gammaproteobacteria bacterium]
MQTSIRTNVVVAIGLMGFLGLLSALITGEVFRHLAIENQRAALRTLIHYEATAQLEKLSAIGREFNSAFQKESSFITARANDDVIALARSMDDQFFQYYITARVLSVARLFVLDKDVVPITASNEGDVTVVAPDIVCPRFIERARRRIGAERVQIMNEMCAYNHEGYYAMLYPVGGLVPKGYFLILAKPETTVSKIEKTLGMPISILHSNGEIHYRSREWPTNVSQSDTLIAHLDFYSPEGEPSLRIEAASDISELNTSLRNTLIAILIGVSLITLLAAISALMLLNRTMLTPLRTLARYLRLIHTDNSHIGEELILVGNPEVRSLMGDFNKMTRELKTLYKKLEIMAFTDSLTSLPNRSLLQEALLFQTSATKKKGVPFAFLMMDMDRFKAINDTLGHQAGDHLLQQVGRRLEKALRKTDTIARLADADFKRLDLETIARLGGDEFAAVLPGVSNREEASIVVEKIMREMSEVMEVNGLNISVNISIGIALCPQDGSDPNTLMHCADIAMYQAKNRQLGYSFYESSLDTNSRQLLALENELQTAIERDDELLLFFQPKICLFTHSISGLEALVYWRHPQKGLIRPDDFIPMAEETGLIVSLTTWIFHRAAQQHAYFKQHQLNCNVAINLSARSLQNDTILSQLDQILRLYNISPSDITLELTETSVMTDINRSLELLSQLDQRGVKLSLDDFGAGYTSLHYLKAFPIDELKIDRSFIRDMQTVPADAAIVQSVIELAHNMGLKVVAEGVEDATTLDLLKVMQCDVAQGYFFTKPLPPDEIIAWLKDNGY